LDLCKGKGDLVLDEMSKLYVEELAIAGAAARGEHTWAKGEGDHVGESKKALLGKRLRE
jgi:fructose-bisphosphate aldolase class I